MERDRSTLQVGRSVQDGRQTISQELHYSPVFLVTSSGAPWPGAGKYVSESLSVCLSLYSPTPPLLLQQQQQLLHYSTLCGMEVIFNP